MVVRVRYYALFRELAGVYEDRYVVDPDTTLAKLLNLVSERHPRLREYFDSSMYVVLHNLRPVADNELSMAILRDGDLVDIMPPPSGGSYEVRLLRDDERVVLDDVVRELKGIKGSVKAGAIAVFIGFVKGEVGSTKVYELRYEVNEEYTLKSIERILKDVLSKYTGVLAIRLFHRVGTYRPGDDVFYVFVLGVSRRDVVPALTEVIERVKHEVGIWKLERRDDGLFWVLGDGMRVKSEGT